MLLTAASRRRAFSGLTRQVWEFPLRLWGEMMQKRCPLTTLPPLRLVLRSISYSSSNSSREAGSIPSNGAFVSPELKIRTRHGPGAKCPSAARAGDRENSSRRRSQSVIRQNWAGFQAAGPTYHLAIASIRSPAYLKLSRETIGLNGPILPLVSSSDTGIPSQGANSISVPLTVEQPAAPGPFAHPQ